MHGFALFPFGGFTKDAEDLFQALHVGFGLLQVIFKGSLEFFVVSSFGHLGQSLEQLFFGVVQVLEFFDKRFT